MPARGDSARAATCSIATLLPLVDTLRQLGVDAERVVASAGIAPAQLSDPALRIRVQQSMDVWDAAYRAAGDPALGLRMVERLDFSKFRLFAYLAASSATAREAWLRAKRYLRIVNDAMEVEVEFEGGRSFCRTGLRGFELSRSQAEFSVGLMLKIAPRVVGDTGHLEAWFRHANPGYPELYASVLGCPVHFGARFDGIGGSPALLDAPLPRADSELCALLEEQAREELARVPAAGDLVAVVRHRISAALPDGDSGAEAVASGLGMSARTLRRRLREQGTTHQQLLDEVRHQLASRTLEQPGVSVNEVAFLLGFSDASAFHKAFRRWTGRGPTEALRASSSASGAGRSRP
jgi:AraC-like DNA-binding protein